MSDPEVEQWLRHAETMRARGNADAAIDALKHVLARDPTHGRAHASLAHTLLSMRRLPAAEQEIALALQLSPDDPTVLFAAGAVLIAARRLDRARKAIEQLLQADATDAMHYVLAAQLCIEERRFDEADTHLDVARDLSPNDADVLLLSGELAFAEGKLDEAEAYAEEALEASPQHTDARLLAGRLDLQRGRVDAAREHAMFAMKQDATDPEALQLLVSIKARESAVTGVWWRLNAWLSGLSDERLMATLLAGFVLSQILVIVADELDFPLVAAAFHYLWLGVCVYTWFGPALFTRTLRKELGIDD